VHQQEWRARTQACRRLEEVERLEPRLAGLEVAVELDGPAGAQVAQQPVRRRRTDRNDGAHPVPARARRERPGVDRLEPAHAAPAQGHVRSVLAQELHHRQGVVEGAGPEAPAGSAMAARVVRERRDPILAAAAGEVEVGFLRGAGAVQDHHARDRFILREEQRECQAVVDAQLGRCGRGVAHRFIIAARRCRRSRSRMSTPLAPA
jgi:hypothetical protein